MALGRMPNSKRYQGLDSLPELTRRSEIGRDLSIQDVHKSKSIHGASDAQAATIEDMEVDHRDPDVLVA